MGEGGEKLVVQVVTVGEDDDGGVLHLRLAHDGAGVEGHGQAFSRPLGMPDHPDAAVAGSTARLEPRFVAAALLGNRLLQLRRPQGLSHGGANGVKLVVAGHLLGQPPAAIIIEHDEVADQFQKALRLADALQHYLQLSQCWVGQSFPGWCARA